MKKNIFILLIIILILFISIISVLFLIQYQQNKKTPNTDDLVISKFNNPIVPKGFKKVETTLASWKLENGIPVGWNNGLVIEDDIGNQFVWIPTKLDGIFYPSNLVDEKFQYTIDNLNINNVEDRQILKYGGFYISRYEAGASLEMQKNLNNLSAETNDVLGIPVSQKGVIPWNYISLKKAKINAESMYNNDSIKSGLPTLKQWQYMMAWLYSCGYNVYEDSSNFGNYSNVNFPFSGYYSDDYGVNFKYAKNKIKSDKNMILSCGATDRNMTNNIYDVAGNLWSYTNDYLQINRDEILGYYCVGGHFDHTGNNFPAYSYNLKNVKPLEKVGFRIVLYME